jgi:hypothetical protein
MKLTILSSKMTYSKEDGYLGHVGFQVENHKNPYEITLHSKRGKDWDYALNFLNESGSEEDISAVEEMLAESDESFDLLVESARSELVEE